MSESILPESDAGAAALEPAGGGGAPRPVAGTVYSDPAIHCEFCESRITRAKGEVLELGKRARTLRDLELKVEQLEKDKLQLETRILELTPKPAPAGERKSGIRW